jgi:Na+-driven multidrug efflux pump
MKKAVLFSASVGTLEVDALSIAQQYLFLFYQLPLGIAIAGNIYPGHFIGANKPAEAINATKVFYTLICS